MVNYFKQIKKSSIWFKLLIVFLILYALVHTYNKNKPVQEGFVQNEKFIMKKNNDIYDSFYVDLYDDLVYDQTKNNFEIGEIKRITNMQPKKSVVLDIGSGSGHHLHLLHKHNIQCEGLEKSKAMIQKCKSKNPLLHIKHGDALISMTYMSNSFTHIVCLYFTLYYMKDKLEFFKNCYQWLKPGGYLAIHLVNRDLFNPIVNSADPLLLVSPQKYAKERITNSIIKFKDFQYKADFKLEKHKDQSIFEETFKDDVTGHVRKNQHIFYMETQKEILGYAKDAGFNLLGKLDMVSVQYEYQYIYILYKPE